MSEPAPASASLSEALQRIDRFELAQARRIQQAYSVLGPLLQRYEQGDVPEDFRDKWSNLAEMRWRITGDLEAMREAARDQDAAGVANIQLNFPAYPLFID